MNKKILFAFIIGGIILVPLLVIFLNNTLPDTLPPGQTPEFSLPFNSAEHINWLQGFWTVGDQTHNGIDFQVNATTPFYAMHDAHVSMVMKWYNERGGHYQVNVNFRINEEWEYSYAVEPWGTEDIHATWQENNISVKKSEFVKAGQNLGNLLYLGDTAHIHLSIVRNGVNVCPRDYLNATAQTLFDEWWNSRDHVGTEPCRA